MAGQDQGRESDFFGPLWTWLMIGVGLLLMASAYGFHEIGVTDSVALAPFFIGAIIILAIMFYLVVEGRKTWRAIFWYLHLDDVDLLMGRRKNE